jgi:hypothetical protein
MGGNRKQTTFVTSSQGHVSLGRSKSYGRMTLKQMLELEAAKILTGLKWLKYIKEK